MLLTPYIAVSLAKAAILFAIIPISILVLQTYKIIVDSTECDALI